MIPRDLEKAFDKIDKRTVWKVVEVYVINGKLQRTMERF